MANKLLLADGQYEVITVDTILVGIAGKQYWYRNGSASVITVTYGGALKALNPNEVVGLVYDGVVWTELSGKDGLSDVLPIGGIFNSSAGVIPTGFVEANGQALSRVLYSLLNSKYEVMGYPYGDGDGSTTFNVPDLPAESPFITIVNARRVADQEYIDEIEIDSRLSGLESQNIALTVTGSTTIGSEGVLDVNVGTATITVPELTVGIKKTIRKISSSVGTITINLPATHTFTDGSSSITLTNQYEEVTIERVSTTKWTAVQGVKTTDSPTFSGLTATGLLTVGSSGITSSGATVDLLKPLKIKATGNLVVNELTGGEGEKSGLEFYADNPLSKAKIIPYRGASSERNGLRFYTYYGSARMPMELYARGVVALGLLQNTLVTLEGALLVNTRTDNGVDKLQANGSTANTTGVWAVLSDERIKINIRDVSDPLQKALDLAECVKQYEYMPEAEMIEGLRTQYIAQKLIEKGFEGHVKKTLPKNEAVGEILGWEYADEEYTEKETVKEIIVDEQGNEQEIDVEKDVIKTRRIAVKEGDKLLQVENNFAPYAFPAIKALKEENDMLRQMILDLTARVIALEEK